MILVAGIRARRPSHDSPTDGLGSMEMSVEGASFEECRAKIDDQPARRPQVLWVRTAAPDAAPDD